MIPFIKFYLFLGMLDCAVLALDYSRSRLLLLKLLTRVILTHNYLPYLLKTKKTLQFQYFSIYILLASESQWGRLWAWALFWFSIDFQMEIKSQTYSPKSTRDSMHNARNS